MESGFSSHKFAFNRINLSIFIPPLVLVALGLAAFYSIDIRLFTQQLIFLGVSVAAFLIFLNVDYRIFITHWKYLYWIMLGLLLALFFIGIEAKGAVRWVDIFGIRLQFSEVIKPFFVIFFATYLTQEKKRTITVFIKALALLFPIFFLTLKQPDLGNALIYLFVSLGMLFISGFPIRYFIALFFSVALPFPLLFNLLHDYQKARLLTFVNNTSDPFGSSYNAIQALISIGSGGFLGKGFGQATQSILKFLPERHTDFIFATIAESIGFIGGGLIISLFLFLLFTIYKESQKVNDELSYKILMGFFFLLLTHTFLNIGMNVGLMPIVGITLPFVSYGGSSLMTNFIALGIISSIIFEYNKKQTWEIR